MRASKIINKLNWPINFLRYKSLNGINSRKDFFKTLNHERERADRNNHKVSLVVFNLGSFPDKGKERKQLIKTILKEKRSIDDVGWYNKYGVGVILPYTSSQGAQKFSIRLCRTLNFIMPDAFCSLYTYPFENKSEDDAKNIPDDVGIVSDDIEDVPETAKETSDVLNKKYDDYSQNISIRRI